MSTETRGYKTIVYWKGEMLSFEPVPDEEVEKTLKKYRKKGFNAEPISDGLIKKIAESLKI
jgi:Cdc6-like AAA superfamily ATPase